MKEDGGTPSAVVGLDILICTYNRADGLDRTLGALHGMDDVAHCEWDVTVVNNNCTDHTEHVVQSWADKGLLVSSVAEPTQGLTPARQRG